MAVVWQLGLIVVLSLGLMKATGLVVGALNGLVKRTKLGSFGAAAFLAAIATSLPELVVGITAAMQGKPEVSLGNVLGSNIADVSLGIGGAALVGGSVGVLGEILKRDFATAFLAAALPLVLLIDGQLTRFDGWVLIVVYVIYNVMTLGEGRGYGYKRLERVWGRIWHKLGEAQTEKQLGWLVVGTVGLVVTADWLVKTATNLANTAGISVFLISLFLVAVGTSLPELAFEIKTIRAKQIGMVFGNLLGSVVANSTLILGLTVVINPIILENGFKSYLIATMVFVLVFGLFWWLARTKRRLDRWEGLVLVGVYLVFAWWEFAH